MKTKFYLVGSVCAASLALGMPLNAQLAPATTASPATSPDAAASPAAKPAVRPMQYRGKVTAADQTLKTFTIGNQTFKVTDTTIITKGGKPATMTDVVVNEQARGAYLKQDDGTLEAKTVKIGPGGKKGGKGKKGAAAAASPTP